MRNSFFATPTLSNFSTVSQAAPLVTRPFLYASVSNALRSLKTLFALSFRLRIVSGSLGFHATLLCLDGGNFFCDACRFENFDRRFLNLLNQPVLYLMPCQLSDFDLAEHW